MAKDIGHNVKVVKAFKSRFFSKLWSLNFMFIQSQVLRSYGWWDTINLSESSYSKYQNHNFLEFGWL